ncbi:hypothetical protein B0O99DRAFT_636687 [Bisporella sp. PMI_857]|nr:hypothetical protein B0O99DRAFT_636687 [Bisporella sp. PMI_857]
MVLCANFFPYCSTFDSQALLYRSSCEFQSSSLFITPALLDNEGAAMGALSKGCGSCKRRKVKCDDTRPNCTRCIAAGIKCAGFTQRLRFVDEEPRIRRSMAVSHAQSLELSTVTRRSQLVFHRGQIHRSQPPSPAPFSANTLPLTAFKDDIFMSYLVSKLFGETRYPWNAAEETRCGLPIAWITELVKTPQMLRYKSWDSLAAIIFGQAHKSANVITNARRLYGQALVEIRNQLSDPDDRRAESTLASITALSMYEIFASKTEKAWMWHANGLGWLLERRGPWQQKSYARKSMFLEHRIMLVAKSIISRQRTFLCDPIWKTVPWEDDSASKLAIDYLVDIGTDIGGYLAQVKACGSNKSTREPEYSQLRTQVALCLGEMNDWWCQWEAEHARSATEIPIHQANIESLFPTLLEYDMPWTAFTVCIHNAIRILLLQLWQMLLLSPNSIQPTDQGVVLDMLNGTALLGITSDTRGLACEILRSLKYCYRKSRRFISTFSFLFIQDVAYGCFDQGSREALWIAGHGWAELINSDGTEDANLLERQLPLGQIKGGNVG